MKKNIWVEQLGVADLVALIIETLFSGASVLYDENKVSDPAAHFIGIVKKCGFCKNFYMAKLTMTKKDVMGYALTYHMENDLDICLNKFCDKYLKDESARFNGAVRLYITTSLTARAAFVTMIESESAFKDVAVANEIYLKRNSFNSIIIPYYKEKGYVIRESFFSSEYLVQYLKPFYRSWSIILAKLSSARVRATTCGSKPSVWVEYVHDTGIDHLFWREGVDEEIFDIICYLDRNDNFPFDEQTGKIEKKRLKWIDLHFCSLVKLSGIGVRELIDMWSVFISCPPGLPFWFRIFRFEFRMWRLLYEPVFRRFKVKVLIQHQDALWIKEPQLVALEAAGGVMLGFHWSNIATYKMAFWSHPQHVYFVWGKIMYEWLQKRGNMGRHVLPVGLWLNPTKNNFDTHLKGDLTFVMAIFDTSLSYNSGQSADTLAEFYLRILEILEKNLEWGGIAKSKRWSLINDLEFLPHGKEIVLKATSLINQKRLTFLDKKISPIAASAHADISVCYSLNSAGVISGIRGYKAVHWDCTGYLNNPFYRDKNQKFIFSTLEGVEDALTKAYQGDDSIGDFSSWRQYVSHFNDDTVPGRVGAFIQDFMVAVSERGDAKAALEWAVNRYVDVNGIDDSFYVSDGIWEDEKMGAI